MAIIDRTRLVYHKVKRAEKHISDLDGEVRAFMATNPYRTVAYDEANTRERVIKLQILRRPKVGVSLILGDAIHNLRSALDHLAYQLVLANGQKPTDRVAFPVFPRADLEKFEASFRRKINGASKQALDLIKAQEPYKGGNNLLCGLHQLDIMDKHRILVPVMMINPVSIVRLPNVRHRVEMLASKFRPPLENGTELFRMPSTFRPKDYYDPEFQFEVGFGDVLEGEPLLTGLEALSGEVKRIFKTFRPLLIQ